MEAVTIGILSVTAALTFVLALAVTLAWRASVRRTSAEIAELRAIVEELTGSRFTRGARGHSSGDKQSGAPEPVMAEFIITDIGVEAPEPHQVANTVVLSSTVGEPLVKLASLAHGVRRALTPENRNRIRFEMKRELRRIRKARRAAERDAVRRGREQVAS